MLHFFINPDTGKTMYIPEMPQWPEGTSDSVPYLDSYYDDLKQAKEKSIEVKNQDDVKCLIFQENKHKFDGVENYLHKPGVIYTLDDSYKVEIIEEDTVEDGGGCFVAGSKEVAVVSKIKE